MLWLLKFQKHAESCRRKKVKKPKSRFEGIDLYTNLSTGLSILNVSNMLKSVGLYLFVSNMLNQIFYILQQKPNIQGELIIGREVQRSASSITTNQLLVIIHLYSINKLMFYIQLYL